VEIKNAAGEIRYALPHAGVDEVDQLMGDEARTPVILSGLAGSAKKVEKYFMDAEEVARRLKNTNRVYIVKPEDELNLGDMWEDLEKNYDAIVNPKDHSITLTDRGLYRVERELKELRRRRIELWGQGDEDGIWEHL